MKKKSRMKYPAVMLIVVITLAMTACGSSTVQKSAGSDAAGSTGLSNSSSASGQESSSSAAQTVTARTDAASSDTAGQDSSFTVGTIDGNIYSNAFMGFQYTLPDGWSFYDADQMAQLNSWASSNFSDDYIKEQLDSGKVYIDMYAVSTDRMQAQNVVLQNLKGSFGSSLLNADTIIDMSLSSVKSQLESQGMTDVTAVKEEASFLGTQQPCVSISATYNDISIYEKEVFIKKGDYIACVTTTSYQTDTTQELFDAYSAE